MVNLVNLACGETYLVAVRREARGRSCRYNALGELAGEGIFKRLGGIGRACYAHGLEHIRSAREGVAYRAAQAGRRTAERLYLRRVVVRFVFEHHGVLFGLAVKLNVDVYRAGVYLLRFVEVWKFSVLFELLCPDCCNVHEAGVLIRPARIEFIEQVVIELVGLIYAGIVALYLNVRYLRRKRGVAAVVGPVCIDNFELGLGGVALFGYKVVAHEREVFDRHSKAHLSMIGGDLSVAHGGEALHRLHIGGLYMLVNECRGLFKADFLALHGVYEVLFELFHLVGGGALYGVYPGALYERPLLLGEELNALGGAVGTLVVLAREVGYGKHRIVFAELRVLPVDIVDGGLGEYARNGRFKLLLRHALRVVANEKADILYVVYAEEIFSLVHNFFGLQIVFLFNENSVNHTFQRTCHQF